MHAQEYTNRVAFMQVVLCQFLMINKSHGFCFVFVLLAPPNDPTLVRNLGFVSGSLTEHRQHHYLHDRLGQGHIWFRIAISGDRKWPLTKRYKKLLYQEQQDNMDYPPRNTHICLEIPRKKLSIFWKLHRSSHGGWLFGFLPVTSWMTGKWRMTSDIRELNHHVNYRHILLMAEIHQLIQLIVI